MKMSGRVTDASCTAGSTPARELGEGSGEALRGAEIAGDGGASEQERASARLIRCVQVKGRRLDKAAAHLGLDEELDRGDAFVGPEAA